jgi:hypothetical protein
MQSTVQKDDEKGISDGSFLRRQAAQEIGEVCEVVKLVSKKKVSTYNQRRIAGSNSAVHGAHNVGRKQQYCEVRRKMYGSSQQQSAGRRKVVGKARDPS